MIALTLQVLVSVALLYYAWCSSKAGKHRRKIVNYVFHGTNGEFQKPLAEYEKVSFNQHLNRLFFFRDPRKLYPFLPQDFKF